MLSGGQKQRLAIARSIVSNPRVLLLDEATSALDADSERIVQQALNNIALDRTVVVIAHRLSTVRHAHNIIVMSNGTILEQGTHTELIELDSAYSRLVEAQDLGQDNDGSNVDHETEAKPDPIVDEMKAPTASGTTPEEDGRVFSDEAINYNLIKSLAIIIRERRELWVPFAVLAGAATLAGM